MELVENRLRRRDNDPLYIEANIEVLPTTDSEQSDLTSRIESA